MGPALEPARHSYIPVAWNSSGYTGCPWVILSNALLLSKVSWIGLSVIFLLLRVDTDTAEPTGKGPQCDGPKLPIWRSEKGFRVRLATY